MDTAVFTRFRDLIHRESGIALSHEKTSLLQSRIGRRLRELGLGSERQYLEMVELDASGFELRKLLDAVSTNVTHFYREGEHFRIFGELLAAQRGRRELKLWSAAASSGEEPYTMAMVAREILGPDAARVRILGTDISTRVLEHALARTYETAQLRELPELLRRKFFERHGDEWRVKGDVASMVTFKRLNLAVHPLPLKGPLDFVFCRNVMIYFDHTLREELTVEFARLLRPGGYLFLSHTETLVDPRRLFAPVAPAVYRRCEP